MWKGSIAMWVSKYLFLGNVGVNHETIFQIESTKITSMEDVSTGVLEKIKNIQEVKIKPKNDMMYKDIYNCICKNTKKWRYTIQYVKPTAQLVFKNRFPKGGPTCRRQVVNPWHQTSQGQSVANMGQVISSGHVYLPRCLTQHTHQHLHNVLTHIDCNQGPFLLTWFNMDK